MTKKVNSDRQCIQDGECRPRHSSHKDTAHWCKGREGMAHEYEWREDLWWTGLTLRGEPAVMRLELICRECGRRGPGRSYKCSDCLAPITSFFVTHGQFCRYKDRRFFNGHGLETLSSIERDALRYPDGTIYKPFRWIGNYLTARERLDLAHQLLKDEAVRLRDWDALK